MLTLALNAVVLFLSVGIVIYVQSNYMDMIRKVIPTIGRRKFRTGLGYRCFCFLWVYPYLIQQRYVVKWHLYGCIKVDNSYGISDRIYASSPYQGFHLITDEVVRNLPPLPQTGLLYLFIKHTSAALSINENADPDVRTDMESIFNHLIKL